MMGEFSRTLILVLKKRVSDVILENSNLKKARLARDLQDIDAETKKHRDSSNLDVPDMSVRKL